jgi:hypothetical protein
MQLVDGHIYTDGKILYQASAPSGAPFAMALYRLNIYNGMLVYPIVAGSLVGYFLYEHEGEFSPGQGWYVLRVGDPKYTDEDKVLRPDPYFEIDVLPTLTHVADSLLDYLKGA